MMDTFDRKLNYLFTRAKKLEKIRKILNICLTTGAYSEKNMMEQVERFNKLNVPQWEQEFVSNAYDFQKKLSHELLKKLEELFKNDDQV